MSHPSWVCGLKQYQESAERNSIGVTPFVGVWIETMIRKCFPIHFPVTPFVGVWIETYPRTVK